MIWTAKRYTHGAVDDKTVAITLPDMPFATPPANIDETAPTAPTIRGDWDWRRDKEISLALWRARI